MIRKNKRTITLFSFPSIPLASFASMLAKLALILAPYFVLNILQLNSFYICTEMHSERMYSALKIASKLQRASV